MNNALYVLLGVTILVVAGYLLIIRTLIRQSRAIDRNIDYSKLRPPPADEDDY